MQLAERRVILKDARVSQMDWRRSYLAPTRTSGESQHAMPLRLCSDLLGGGATSRLYRSLVVDQKLAANAGARYSSTGLDRGLFVLYATPAPGVSLKLLEDGIDAELTGVLKEGFTKDALERTRSGLLAAAIYARDSLFAAPRIFGDALTSGLTVDQVESWPSDVKAITMEQVMAAGRAVLDRRRSVTGLLRPEVKPYK